MDTVVVDDWASHRRPLGALRRQVDSGGRLGRHNLHAELGEIVAGRAPGRERPEERTLFWHRGLATTDLAVARLLLHRAAEAGLGTCCATADLDVPAGPLCAVRDVVADFEVVATAAGQRPAEDRGNT